MSTAACLLLDPASGRLTYSRAGHPPPLVVDAGRAPAARRRPRPGAGPARPPAAAHRRDHRAAARARRCCSTPTGWSSGGAPGLDVGLARMAEVADELRGLLPGRWSTVCSRGCSTAAARPTTSRSSPPGWCPGRSSWTCPPTPPSCASLRRAVHPGAGHRAARGAGRRPAAGGGRGGRQRGRARLPAAAPGGSAPAWPAGPAPSRSRWPTRALAAPAGRPRLPRPGAADDPRARRRRGRRPGPGGTTVRFRLRLPPRATTPAAVTAVAEAVPAEVRVARRTAGRCAWS